MILAMVAGTMTGLAFIILIIQGFIERSAIHFIAAVFALSTCLYSWARYLTLQ